LNIYEKPELYDAIHKDYRWDNKLVKYFANKAGGPVLELASGTGRLAKIILELGLVYTGLDTSKEYIKISKKRYGARGTFHVQNMQNFRLKTKFSFIFIGFNSFLHNLTDDEAINCLKCVSDHLTDNGLFLLSAYIPDPSFLFRNPNKLSSATDYFTFKNHQCRIMERNLYNQETEINRLTWFLEKDGELQPEKYSFKMRMFYPHTMDLLFENSGLMIKEKLGDYDGSRMNQDSDMQIYICKKQIK
jgi:SAM-dependent methyltransferase